MLSPLSLVPGATPVKDTDGCELTEDDHRAPEKALLAAEDAASSTDAEAHDRRIDDIAAQQAEADDRRIDNITAQLEQRYQQDLEADWIERSD